MDRSNGRVVEFAEEFRIGRPKRSQKLPRQVFDMWQFLQILRSSTPQILKFRKQYHHPVPRNAEVIRQWTILREIKRARAGGVTIDELAALCDVTTRTIRRDLQALEEAGFPLFDDRSGDDGKTRWKVNGQAFKGL